MGTADLPQVTLTDEIPLERQYQQAEEAKVPISIQGGGLMKFKERNAKGRLVIPIANWVAFDSIGAPVWHVGIGSFECGGDDPTPSMVQNIKAEMFKYTSDPVVFDRVAIPSLSVPMPMHADCSDLK